MLTFFASSVSYHSKVSFSVLRPEIWLLLTSLMSKLNSRNPKFGSLSILEVSDQPVFFDRRIATASATLLRMGVGDLVVASYGKRFAWFY